MAYSRRCSICGTNWPYMSAYVECPICEEDTWFQSDGVDPLTQLEAQQIIAAHEPQIAARREAEVKMDVAFNTWFLRENGIAPLDQLAKNGETMAPLSEFLPL
ncbi:MAG: hypothetical protein ACXVGC_09810 [Mycobacteriaceae bacterium]